MGHILEVRSTKPTQLVDITGEVSRLVSSNAVSYSSRADEGYVLLHCLHTTAGLWVNEREDGLEYDLCKMLDRFAPVPTQKGETYAQYRRKPLLVGQFYMHDALDVRTQNLRDEERPNGWAHMRALLFSPTILIPFEKGKLKLGTYQSVFFVELDGPQERKVYAQVSHVYGGQML